MTDPTPTETATAHLCMAREAVELARQAARNRFDRECAVPADQLTPVDVERRRQLARVTVDLGLAVDDVTRALARTTDALAAVDAIDPELAAQLDDLADEIDDQLLLLDGTKVRA